MQTKNACQLCAHFEPDENGPACTAFPDGIPDEIFVGGFDHRKEYPGDEGVRFRPRQPKYATLVDEYVAQPEAPETPEEAPLDLG